MTPDSACTASAIYSGVKTTYGTFGYDSGVERKVASSIKRSQKVSTIAEWFQEAGKATGLVTTARVTHATPGALYAQTIERDYECDGEILFDDQESKDIAWQLVNQEPGRNLKVILGKVITLRKVFSRDSEERPSI